MKASPGYPIPHKSLAVGWGLREAWQNCIKQEQTSHTFLFVSYVKTSGRQNLFTWNIVSAFHLLSPYLISHTVSMCFSLVSGVWRWWKTRNTLLQNAAYRAVCDLIVKEWELLHARKQLITHVLGRFEPDTVGDVDGDAMCLDVKLQTAVRPSLLSH